MLLKFLAQRQIPVRRFGGATYAGDAARGEERVSRAGAMDIPGGQDMQMQASAGAVRRRGASGEELVVSRGYEFMPPAPSAVRGGAGLCRIVAGFHQPRASTPSTRLVGAQRSWRSRNRSVRFELELKPRHPCVGTVSVSGKRDPRLGLNPPV